MILEGLGAESAYQGGGGGGGAQPVSTVTFDTGDTIVGKVPKKTWDQNPIVMGGIAALALFIGFRSGRK